MLKSWLFVALLCLAQPLSAQNICEKLNCYGKFLHHSSLPNVLFYVFDIEDHDTLELRRALRNEEIDTLVLDSPGGSVREGLQIAAIVNDLKINTYVPKQGIFSETGSCTSACAYIYLAGENKRSDGMLGVHQAYSNNPMSKQEVGKTQSSTQFTVSEIIGFLNEFDTPPFVYEKMFSTLGNDMYFFDSDELAKINGVNTIFDDASVSKINDFVVSIRKMIEDEFAKEAIDNATTVQPKPKTPPLRSTIKLSQNELNRLGCSAGFADGIIGKNTLAALQRFNKATGSNLKPEDLSKPWFAENLANYAPIKNCYVQPKTRSVKPSFHAEYFVSCVSGTSSDTALLKTDHFDSKTGTGVFYIDWLNNAHFDGFVNFSLKGSLLELRGGESAVKASIETTSAGKISRLTWSLPGATCERYIAERN